MIVSDKNIFVFEYERRRWAEILVRHLGLVDMGNYVAISNFKFHEQWRKNFGTYIMLKVGIHSSFS